MKEETVQIRVGSPLGIWWPLCHLADYREKVQPLLTKIVRSRGRHQPGSGSYYYGAVRTKDATITSESGVPILFPGGRIKSYGDSSRQEAVWIDNHVYWCGASWRYDTWRYWQTTPFHPVFYRNNDRDMVYGDGFGHIRDFYSSPVWLPPEEVDWAPGGNTNHTDVYTINAKVRFQDPQVDRSIETMMDKLNLVYDNRYRNGIQKAYIDAIQNLPQQSVNNVQNALTALGAIMKLGSGNPKLVVKGIDDVHDLKKAFSEAWLAYRYQYQTTAMDIHETADYLIRYARSKKGIKCNGFFKEVYEGVTYTYRCSFHLKGEDVVGLQSDIEKLGLELSAYNAWDLVPYSFIADWFLRIGDRLEFYEDRNRALKLSPGPVWYSVTKQFETDYSVEDYYWRWQGDPPYISPTLTLDGDPSKSTLIKRAIDVFALI